mmetsp:Transcript_7571/g.20499  ORF Transcript_7571/g.20499 Transcript_7571/m.20499 type:complete len:208 (-) Transcript_7571:289-912(-)
MCPHRLQVRRGRLWRPRRCQPARHRSFHPDHARRTRTEPLGAEAGAMRRLWTHVLKAPGDGARRRHYARRGCQHRWILLLRPQLPSRIHQDGDRRTCLCLHDQAQPANRLPIPRQQAVVAELQGCRGASSWRTAHPTHHRHRRKHLRQRYHPRRAGPCLGSHEEVRTQEPRKVNGWWKILVCSPQSLPSFLFNSLFHEPCHNVTCDR